MFEKFFNIQQKQTKNKESKESQEQKAKEVIGARQSIFKGIIERIFKEITILKEVKKQTADVMIDIPKDPLMAKGYDYLKKVPVLGAFLVAGEANVGASPGKKLNTSESLVRGGVGAAMMIADIADIKNKQEGKEKTDKPFEGLTSKVLDYGIKSLEDKNPKLISALRAIDGFLKQNQETVNYCENKIDEAVKKEKGKR